ncbi:MAG: DUF721 domain-containing protein [Alphaproteobacteria bacterium]|nr:MAG: DUF721 domain-containing protein [Alphaproteobacteria bacterium]
MSSDPAGRQDSRRSRGFRPAAALVGRDIGRVAESRGFAVARLLTQWDEIAGPAIAPRARPVKVQYGRGGGLGATLTLLVRGADAPMVQAEIPRIIEQVNAAYGYRAVSRIRLVQTAPTGFGEPAAEFAHPDRPAPPPDPAIARAAGEAAAGVADPELRAALEMLARNVFSRRKTR